MSQHLFWLRWTTVGYCQQVISGKAPPLNPLSHIQLLYHSLESLFLVWNDFWKHLWVCIKLSEVINAERPSFYKWPNLGYMDKGWMTKWKILNEVKLQKI